MNYLLKSSSFEERRKNARKRVFAIIAIMVIIFSIILTTPVKNSLFFIAKPVWQFENLIMNSNFFEYFKSKQNLITERIQVEQKLFLAGNLLAINTTLQAENEYLKDLLGRKDIKKDTVLASILVKPPQIPYDLLIIDIGEDHNINVGNRVLVNGNVYLGEIVDVYSKTAKVRLYSTPGEKISVVLGSNSVSVEAVGMGGGNFNIYIPQEIEVQEGDVIIVPSIMTNVLGIVEKINFKETDSFQTVLFKSPINISELSFVEVVK